MPTSLRGLSFRFALGLFWSENFWKLGDRSTRKCLSILDDYNTTERLPPWHLWMTCDKKDRGYIKTLTHGSETRYCQLWTFLPVAIFTRHSHKMNSTVVVTLILFCESTSLALNHMRSNWNGRTDMFTYWYANVSSAFIIFTDRTLKNEVIFLLQMLLEQKVCTSWSEDEHCYRCVLHMK
jgi:hypothetical protein